MAMFNPFWNSIHFVFLIDMDFLSIFLIVKFHYLFSNPNSAKLSFPFAQSWMRECFPLKPELETGHEPSVIVLRLFPLVPV